MASNVADAIGMCSALGVTASLSSKDSTAGKFFDDPQFYDNMTGVAGDLRLLLNEFRQNPSKFLKVKFSLF